MNRSAAWSLMAAMGSFAFVAAGATNTFESAEGTVVGERPAEWTGYCVVSNQVGSYALCCQSEIRIISKVPRRANMTSPAIAWSICW